MLGGVRGAPGRAGRTEKNPGRCSGDREEPQAVLGGWGGTPAPRSQPTRGPTGWRQLPVQAFVHETHIPAAAVAILRFDFATHRRLHGTRDGEWVLTGAQRWVPACSRLQEREQGVSKGRGEDSNRPPHFPALRGRPQSRMTAPLKESLTFTAPTFKVKPFRLLVWNEWATEHYL